MQSQSQEEDSVCSNCNQTALYDRFGQVIFGYLRFHAPSLEDAEDLLLEVFLAALEKDNLSALSPEEQLAWLRQVAHHKLFNVYRRAHRRPQVSLDSLAETLFAEESPEQFALEQEERRQLRVHIKQLPALQQQLLQLRYGYGLRCPEIALLLNKREGAVRQLLSRTIQRLRLAYHHQEGESTC